MNINNPSSAQLVWSITPRTLTGLGGAINIGLGADVNSLANGSTAGFATAGMAGHITIVGLGLANVTWNFGILGSDAVFRSGTQGVIAHSLMINGHFTPTRSLAINNSGTVSGQYSVVIIGFVQ